MRGRKRSNSFNSKLSNNQERSALVEIKKELIDNNLIKSIIMEKKEMLSLKKIQNIDLATYDYIFISRQFLNTTIQDFESFINLLNTIKNKYNPSLFKANKNMEKIIKQGKFSISNSNLTNLVSFNENHKKAEISINTSYIKIPSDVKNSFIFYTTKSFFKGKHCFEIEVMSMTDQIISYGLINMSYIKSFKEYLNSSLNYKINPDYVNIFKLNNPIFYTQYGTHYNHFITYGDVLGLCFNLEQNLLCLYINGVLKATHILTLKTGENCSLVPLISVGKATEIIFNPGGSLKYKYKYDMAGFNPLDEELDNNYEISKMKEVTDEFIDILINKGKSIIMNKNITNSDINQIYHIIFDFLANISFEHSYIIQKSFIKSFIDNYSCKKLDNNELEIYYICLKYILNFSNNQKIILKNLFFNLAESIHILMIDGNANDINKINLLMKLFSFLFAKKEIMDIFSQMKLTTKKLFKAIFVSFHINIPGYKNNYLDFEINDEENKIINNNNNNEYFPNLISTKYELEKRVSEFNSNLKNISNNILNLFNDLIISIFKNGTDSQNKNIFNIFKEFLENEINNMFIRSNRIFFRTILFNYFQINNIFKNIFIPGMNLFNKQYKKKYKNNKNSLSIKKYLKKDELDGEKIGGTIKHIFDEYPQKIPNFQELLKYNIKDYNNIFFFEFINTFIINENSISIWISLISIIKRRCIFVDFGFLSEVKKKSFEVIYSSLIDYINNKLFSFKLDDLEIFLQFLFNFSDILDDLFSTELVYFLPEKIFMEIGNIMEFLSETIDLLMTLLNKELKNENESNELSNSISKLLSIAENSIKQYILILIKFIKDKNIKKLILKCETIKFLQNYIYYNSYFTEEDIIFIFDFIYLIHNDVEYKNFVYNFMKIFDNNMNNTKNKFYKFGVRLIKIIKKNKHFLRIIIILLYSTINKSLTNLEEKLCEYKFNPTSNRNNNIQIYNIPNNNGGMQNEIFRIVDFIIRRENNELTTEQEKLLLLEETFIDTKKQFLKLINFYQIATDIDELYELNSFENKNLSNLLVSLYNIIFTKNNIEKLIDEKTKNINSKYITLLSSISIFYKVLVKNILENAVKKNNDNFLKDLSKQRNIYHFKDIFQIFEKYNTPSKQDISSFSVLNDFMNIMEKLIPEKELIKLNNDSTNNNIETINSENKIEKKNICPICADSVVDTHILPCEHSICKNCLFLYLAEKNICPFCRVEIKGIKEDPNFKV